MMQNWQNMKYGVLILLLVSSHAYGKKFRKVRTRLLITRDLYVRRNGIIGGNLTINGSETVKGNITSGGTITANTETFANYIPSYAPLTSAMAGNVNFYGDSISAGLNATPLSQRWTTLLSNYFSPWVGTIENNFAEISAQVSDSIPAIYNSYGPGTNRTTFHAFGINDLRINNLYNTWDELRRTTECMVLFCCLPDSQKVNAQNASQTGIWTNATAIDSTGNWGLTTTDPNATLTATVVGRFICISMPCVTNTVYWDVTIDGVPIIVAQPLAHNAPSPTQNGYTATEAVYVYDTGSANTTPHTILVKYNAGAPGYIMWFGGFNLNNPNCNTVFIVSTTASVCVEANPPTNHNSEMARQSWTSIQQSVARRLRVEYGLPVYFVDMSYPWVKGMISADSLHPNNNGHNYMFNRAKSVILNGEFNYLT